MDKKYFASRMTLVQFSIVLLLMIAAGQTKYIAYDTVNSICKGGVCGPGEISYDEILHMYKGLFFTEKQMTEKEKKVLQSRRKELYREGINATKVFGLPGDGDSCCATDFSHVQKYILANTDGENRYIVHMPDASPPVYQLIPEASCVTGYGECDGRCVIELFTLNLLVYDLSPDAAWPPLTFDWFAVPGYCSCKNAMTTVSSDVFEAKLSQSSFDIAQP